MKDFSSTWLCPERADRERLLEVDDRLRPAQGPFWGAMLVALLAFTPRYGVAILAPLVAAVVGGAFGRSWLMRRVAPEYAIAGVAVFCQAMLAVGIALTGGATSPALPVMLLAAALVPARFTGSGARVLLGVAVALMIAPCVFVDPSGLAAEPEYLVASVCGMLGLAPVVAVLSGSDREHRAEASLDALTELPNRRALAMRLPALRRQAQARGASLALLACDLDHFKSVNDTYGHVRGDAVLRAFAGRLTTVLRGEDAAYRWGGEEFVVAVVVPHAHAARHAAERVRAAVAGEPIDGLPVTVSIGVAVLEGREEPDEAFARADAALYRAKALGRDRVELDGDGPVAPLIELADAGPAAEARRA